MTLGSGAPAGARRPGHHRAARTDRERGAVTVEAALALLAMTVVLAAVVWTLGLLVAQLSLGEAARAAARSAARSDSTGDVVAEATRLVHDARVEVSRQGELVTIELRRGVRAPGLLSRWGEVELVASATAAAEQP